MRFLFFLCGVIVSAIGYWLVAPMFELDTQSEFGGGPIVVVNLPASLSQNAESGREKFTENCAACHGENAVGRVGFAPPLVHIIYEPNHHGDESFQRAVALGVRLHHWSFGDMAPVDGLSRDDVSAIIAYVRELQRENGIN